MRPPTPSSTLGDRRDARRDAPPPEKLEPTADEREIIESGRAFLARALNERSRMRIGARDSSLLACSSEQRPLHSERGGWSPDADRLLCTIALPAPAGDADALFDTPISPALLWHQPGETTMVGLGCALEVSAESFGDHLGTCLAHPRSRPWTARAFGGMAFDSAGEKPADEPWQDFPANCFFVPRWLYLDDRRNPRWVFHATGRDLDNIAVVENEWRHLCARLLDAGPPPRHNRCLSTDEVTAPEQWRNAVASIRQDIAAGRSSKIVAARCTRVTFSAKPEIAPILRRLRSTASGCTRFAFRFGESVFLGGSPERLIRRSGLDLESEALAGSCVLTSAQNEISGIDLSQNSQQARELLESPKDREEHAWVVQAIRDALAKFCSSIECPGKPQVRALRHLLHLRTPIRGRLSRPYHIVDIVRAVHPTPAVGGVPREHAMEWIRENESLSRGWYAAPVGWFDGTGEGDFSVALRSAVIQDQAAWIFAGAGIVADSDPEHEDLEVSSKQRAMLTALLNG